MIILADIYYVLFFLIGVFILIRLGLDKILFPRTRLSNWDKQEWHLKFHNGISYIYDNPHADTVIVFSHGSGGNLTGRSKIRNLFRTSGVGFLMYDYYGYGAIDDVSRITEFTFTRSITEVMELVPNKKIILMGASLGSYPSCWMAAQNHPNVVGLILCVPFDSFDSFSWLSHYIIGSYDNRSLAKSIKVPTLIIKSEHDKVVPKNSAENLHNTIAGSVIISVLETHKSYLNSVASKEIMNFTLNLLK